MEIGHGWPEIAVLKRQILARLPRFCCFCHQKTNTGYDLCRYCRFHLPTIVASSRPKTPSSVCLNCGFLWSDDVARQECVNCANYPTQLKRIICPFRYHFPIDGMIGRLKYRQQLPFGRLLGSLLAEEVARVTTDNQYPDVLLPVPLSISRYRSRGFNQAGEIAQWCGKVLGIDVFPTAVGRQLDTASLAGLDRSERSQQIRGAFWADPSLKGLSVAVVDDVLTTGATSGELATELIDYGVRDVQLWVVARTPATGKSGTS